MAHSLHNHEPIALMTPNDLITLVVDNLPIIKRDSVPLDDSCPICLMSFASVFAEQDAAVPEETACQGVTKLEGCGHVFCRKDLVEWIRSHHGSCPTCRYTFLDIRPPSESDDESSDGGEYIPVEEDDDDEDGFLDTDGFSETDLDAADFEEVDTMELDLDDIWHGAYDSDSDADMDASEWGLTDGDSESVSEGDVSLGSEEHEGPGGADGVALEVGASVSIHSDDSSEIMEGLNDLLDESISEVAK